MVFQYWGASGFAIMRLCRDTIIRTCANYGGGAGNRTPVRQGPAAGFSVRSLRFSVGSGLPETGYPCPSSLSLSLTRESEAQGAVTICDVHIGILATETPRNGSLLKRPVRNYRWQLLFVPVINEFRQLGTLPGTLQPAVETYRPHIRFSRIALPFFLHCLVDVHFRVAFRDGRSFVISGLALHKGYLDLGPPVLLEVHYQRN